MLAIKSSLFCCGYVDSSLEVKTETDSIDAMEIKTEADSNDITECLHGDLPATGLYRVCIACLLLLLCVL